MEDYEDGSDDSGSDWDELDWPDEWIDWSDEYGWEVYDIDVSVDYGPED